MITVNIQACNMRDILGETDLKSENRKNTTRAGLNPASFNSSQAKTRTKRLM